MKLLRDIGRINDLLEPINFELVQLVIDHNRLGLFEFKNKNIKIRLESSHFGKRFEFLIKEYVEYTFDNYRFISNPKKDPRFIALGCRSVVGVEESIEFGYIKHESLTISLHPTQTEPDLETVIEIIKKFFKEDLRDVKINQLIN